MSNFRTPVNIFLSTLHKSPYCSGSSEKSGQELLKQAQDAVGDKIKSDKLKNLLPYLQHKEKNATSDKLVEESVVLPSSDPINVDQSTTNITLSEISLSLECIGEKTVQCNTHKTLKVSPVSTSTPSDSQAPPQPLPVLMVTKEKAKTVDLSNTMLPLSLHIKDKKSLLVEAVMQDIKHIYFRTTTTIDKWNMVAKTQGKTFYVKAEKFMRDPGAVRNFLEERGVSIYVIETKNALSNISQKSIVLANAASQPAVLERIKEAIENLIASIKKMIKEKTKEKAEKKEKEEK